MELDESVPDIDIEFETTAKKFREEEETPDLDLQPTPYPDKDETPMYKHKDGKLDYTPKPPRGPEIPAIGERKPC